MKRTVILAVMLAFAFQARAQNIIDHYSSIWVSGYGKMAFDGDTLYINILNGHGVARYHFADPTYPALIDWEEAAGFGQIDFERRVMASENNGVISLIDFTDFVHPLEILRLDLSNIGDSLASWKMIGDAIFAVSYDDTIRAYDISDPDNPHIRSSYGYTRRSGYLDVVFGNTVVVISARVNDQGQYIDVYDIRNPDEIEFVYTVPVIISPTTSCDVQCAVGDTISISVGGFLHPYAYATINRFSANDSTCRQLWYRDSDGMPPQGFFTGPNGYEYMGSYYTLNGLRLLGGGNLYVLNFGVSRDDYVLSASPNRLDIYQPSYSESDMTLVYSNTLDHYGVLSTCAYGDYILAGMESNSGELLVHSIGDDWDLFHSGTLPGVPAKDMIIEGTTVMCLCDNKLVAADFTDPGHPIVRHEIGGFSGPLADFDKQDSLIYIVTDHAYSIVSYNLNSGFTILSSLNIPGAALTGVAQCGAGSFVLKGSVGTVIRVNATYPTTPFIDDERRLPQSHYDKIEQLHNTLWASGEFGTDVFNSYTGMDSVAFFGPEYFSNVYKMSVSNDTLYVADGVNGLKVFTFYGHPYGILTSVGKYETGNAVNDVAVIENNFYISDYYSLQHLRWGEPDRIEPGQGQTLPNEFSLEQNYPNPFNSSTSISYSIPVGQQSTLNIYDICGRRARTFDIKGQGNLVWNGRDDAEKAVSSGVYFYKIAGQPGTARKMLLVK